MKSATCRDARGKLRNTAALESRDMEVDGAVDDGRIHSHEIAPTLSMMSGTIHDGGNVVFASQGARLKRRIDDKIGWEQLETMTEVRAENADGD